MRAAEFLCVSSFFVVTITTSLFARQNSTVKVKSDEIGGVVSSAKGVEPGVWVIAETTDLPTRYAKMVVTDDQGRYVVPDLPKAKYKVWVRGYGLVDSSKGMLDEARPYRPAKRQNQRFAAVSGMSILPPAGISGSC